MLSFLYRMNNVYFYLYNCSVRSAIDSGFKEKRSHSRVVVCHLELIKRVKGNVNGEVTYIHEFMKVYE